MSISLKISLFFFFTASLPAHAQLDFNAKYELDFLEKSYYEADAQKDTANLGLAAFLLFKQYRKRDESKFKNFDLITTAIRCFKTVGDSINYYRARGQLVNYYFQSKQLVEAQKLAEGNYEYFVRTGNESMQVHTLFTLGRTHGRLKNKEIAAAYFQKSRILNQTVKDTLIEVLTLTGLIPKQMKTEHPDSVLIVAKRMYNLSVGINRLDLGNLAMVNIAQLYQEKGELDTAIFYLKKVLVSKANKELSFRKLQVLKELSNCYEQQKNYQNAHHYAVRYGEKLDSIENKKQSDAIEKLTIQYEAKEKEQAIKILEKEKSETELRNRQKNYIVGGLCLVLLILLGMIWLLIRFYRERGRKKKIIAQQSKTLQQQQIKMLEDKVELMSIQSMLDGQENERARIARDLHDSLGGMLSTAKLNIQNNPEKAAELLDKATQEIRMIAQNLQPLAFKEMGLVKAVRDLIYLHQQEGESPKITFQHYEVPENLEEKTALHFYRIIQEALHNALKHADASEVLIQINGEPNGLSLMIEDDGTGFDTTEKKEGNGLKNFKKRAEFLKAELTIESGETGTMVYLVWEQ